MSVQGSNELFSSILPSLLGFELKGLATLSYFHMRIISHVRGCAKQLLCDLRELSDGNNEWMTLSQAHLTLAKSVDVYNEANFDFENGICSV